MNNDFKIISKSLNLKKKIATVKVAEGKIRHTVKIEPCYESYMQWGAGTDVLWFTLPIAERLAKNNFTAI